MPRILIVEDEPNIQSFLKKGLEVKGFNTDTASNGQQAVEMVFQSEFDLIILDLGLPDQDGMEVLKTLRGQGFTIPVIILTARDDLDDKILGLESGAEDYLTKPFHFKEILARIQIQLRLRQHRDRDTQEVNMLIAGNTALDLRQRLLIVDGKPVELSAKEFFLAENFFRHPERVFSREELLDLVWGYNYDPGSNVVDVYVRHLRKKLGDRDLIKTVRGIGYKFTSD